MPHTILNGVSISYQLLWNQLRQLGGVHLSLGTDDLHPVDAPHLLTALHALWSEQAPKLVLSTPSNQLLSDLLAQPPVGSPWVLVQAAQLSDPAMTRRVQQAYQRGLKLVWRGEPGSRPSATLAPCFTHTLITLTAQEALAGLRVSLHRHNGIDTHLKNPVSSPVLAGQIYESLPSRALAEHCLDEQGAWGLAGWPAEDVLHGYRHRRIQPGHSAVVALIEALDADESVEHIEQLISEEPILLYRFFRYVNSAGLGLRTEIESIRQGLLVLGFSLIRTWLLEQLPHASSDLNLQPVRTAMVLRARLMAQLVDAGDSDELRREVAMCGLFSQIDLMLAEPMSTALARVQLPERITAAIVGHTGPYLPYLEIAAALESATHQAIRTVCETHQLSSESVNRALLRTLSQIRQHAVKGLLLV
jgi:EAL and modified HD-GYP domain-containing signal transduction protein